MPRSVMVDGVRMPVLEDTVEDGVVIESCDLDWADWYCLAIDPATGDIRLLYASQRSRWVLSVYDPTYRD